ncbi:MAG: thiamine pyrophosphate-dependent enzyme [Pseudomonadota bacterium]
MDPVKRVHSNFLKRLALGALPAAVPPATDPLTQQAALDLFRHQCASRHLDRTSRAMQKAGQGYYTIGSSGHEGMAAVAHATRPDDMAFLHYRDAAFQIARAAQVPGQDPIRDIALSFAAAAEDPISGGRHKVLGSRALNIPPQTSTIASHLPKAVGAAFSIGWAGRMGAQAHLPEDSIVLCSFGDASANHSTAQGAFNAAQWAAFQDLPVPILFVCEDNGIGISVRTPPGWIAAGFAHRPGLKYVFGDGLRLADAAAAATRAAAYVRETRRPAFLHLRTVRLYGHAGSDVAAAYLSPEEIAGAEADDPLLHSAAYLIAAGHATADAVRDIYTGTADLVADAARHAVTRPRLSGAAEVMAALTPPDRPAARANRPDPAARRATFGADAAQTDAPQTLAKGLNWALTDLMLQDPQIAVMGEDVGAKGGVYGVTQRLQERFGRARVFDTLLDEQTVLGLAIGMAHNGLLPIPEIQFLAYLHNAEDQLRGEAATLSFFSNGQYRNPMVVRIAGLGYQRGFGGHFHNDNTIAVLRDIPGLIVACPSTGAEAAGLLRACTRLAREAGRICVLLEPIARYQTRDLLTPGDGGWLTPYPAPDQEIAPGTVAVHGPGHDIALVTYGNGHHLSRQVQARLADQGIAARVIDLRWLVPLPEAALLDATRGCDRILIVDECRRSAGPSEGLMTLFAEADRRARRVTAEDSFIATGPAYAATLPSVEGIMAAALKMLG